MADLLANHSEHSKMLKTCQNALEKSGEIFVIFSAHRPWLLEKDMVGFFIHYFILFLIF